MGWYQTVWYYSCTVSEKKQQQIEIDNEQNSSLLFVSVDASLENAGCKSVVDTKALQRPDDNLWCEMFSS